MSSIFLILGGSKRGERGRTSWNEATDVEGADEFGRRMKSKDQTAPNREGFPLPYVLAGRVLFPSVCGVTIGERILRTRLISIDQDRDATNAVICSDQQPHWLAMKKGTSAVGLATHLEAIRYIYVVYHFDWDGWHKSSLKQMLKFRRQNTNCCAALQVFVREVEENDMVSDRE